MKLNDLTNIDEAMMAGGSEAYATENQNKTTDCPSCAGTGVQQDGHDCLDCHGSGHISADDLAETQTDNPEYTDEVGYVKDNLYTIARMCKILAKTMIEDENLPDWVQEKVANAKGMLVAATDYLESQHEQGRVYTNGPEQMEEDWQKVNKRDRTSGMSRKAVKAYRREHPGSKLQTAVTTKPSKLKKGSKAASRRKSFCARMSGMKKAHASAKTKRDPNSPINKALRRWNCESVEQLQQILESQINQVKQQLAENHRGQDVSENQSDFFYQLERLDQQTRRVLTRMADHKNPGSWLSAAESYAMQLGLQYKNRDPRGWEQEVQHYVDLYKKLMGKQGVAENSDTTHWRVEQSEATGRYYVVTGYTDKSRKVWKNKLGAVDFNKKEDAEAKAHELNQGVAEADTDNSRQIAQSWAEKYPNIDELVARAEKDFMSRHANYQHASGQAYHAGKEADDKLRRLKQIQKIIHSNKTDMSESPDYSSMYESKLNEFASCGGAGGIATSMSVGNPAAGSLFGGSYTPKNSPFKKTAKKRTGKMIKR